MTDRATDRTDWDAYYSAPVPTSRLTRPYTQRCLLRLMHRYARRPASTICELGGANSCFYEALRRAYPDSTYIAIDNNVLGLRMLEARASDALRTRTLNYDITSMPAGIVEADIVFSVGLIEHFTPAQTADVIRRHFSCVMPGGLVLITFPTPTWSYRTTRQLAELLGLWRFPDERPLRSAEVLAEVVRHGTVLSTFTNWPLILTQGVVAARAW
jgi:cyclopropane fatty-acyl-phospholipid synthase-like methyltransferase